MLVYVARAAEPATAQATLALTKPRLLALVAGDTDGPGLEIDGARSALSTLTSVLTAGDPAFNIVTP